MPILRPLASAGKRACWLLMGLYLGLPALANEAPVSFNGTSISLEQALSEPCGATPSWRRWGARPRSPAARGSRPG